MHCPKRAAASAVILCLLIALPAVFARETPTAPPPWPANQSTGRFFLQPRVRAQILVTINAKTFPLLKRVVDEFARLFPDGFTQTAFPRAAADRTTFEGAGWDNKQKKVVYDNSEMLFVDFDPATCRDCYDRVAQYKDFLGQLLGETEVWVTLTPIWRMLTPASPEWSELRKTQSAQ